MRRILVNARPSRFFWGALGVAALAAAGSAVAQSAPTFVGQVISSAPIIQPVTVARQTCVPGVATVPTPSSGAGAVMGAIAGGAIGSNIGSGAGAALATGVGVIAGAMMGDRVEGPSTRTVPTQNCTTQNVLEYRVQGFNVTYEFQGRQYSSQMQFDPGRTVALQMVTVTQPGTNEPAVSMPVPAPAQVAGINGVVNTPQQMAQPAMVAPGGVAPTVVYAAPQIIYADPWWPSHSGTVFIGNGWGGWGPGWGPGWGGHYRSGWGPGWGGGSRASISIGVSRGWGWRGW